MVALLDLLMPPACAGCGRSGALLCPGCLDGLEAPSRPADRFLAPDAGVVVGDALALAVAAFSYDGPMRRALAALKYSGAARLAPILARAASPCLLRLRPITGPATLVPIPLHLERRRSRGYNQAELLARELARQARLPVADILHRARPTTKQHRLNRTARLHNLRDAFVVRRGLILPRTAILVDDIVTTTATLEACASVLRDAGCESVYGFAVAREV
ncbi:MAG TPA: ComF family protein [Candidatus Limnocylindria bacterium]